MVWHVVLRTFNEVSYVRVSFVTKGECNAKALLKDEYIVLIEHYI